MLAHSDQKLLKLCTLAYAHRCTHIGPTHTHTHTHTHTYTHSHSHAHTHTHTHTHTNIC